MYSVTRKSKFLYRIYKIPLYYKIKEPLQHDINPLVLFFFRNNNEIYFICIKFDKFTQSLLICHVIIGIVWTPLASLGGWNNWRLIDPVPKDIIILVKRYWLCRGGSTYLTILRQDHKQPATNTKLYYHYIFNVLGRYIELFFLLTNQNSFSFQDKPKFKIYK